MNELLEAYIEALFWSENVDSSNKLDQSDLDKILADISKLENILESNDLSLDKIQQLSGNNSNRIMHDFVLTRNYQGAGFWDGDYNVTHNNQNLGELLTIISHKFNNTSLLLDEDNNKLLYWDS
jgi:hypothetical protein